MSPDAQRRITEWLRVHRSPEKLPNNEWVAVHPDQGMVAHDPSVAKVVAQLDLAKISTEAVGFSYVSFDIRQ